MSAEALEGVRSVEVTMATMGNEEKKKSVLGEPKKLASPGKPKKEGLPGEPKKEASPGKPVSQEALVAANKNLLAILDEFAESARGSDDSRWYFTVAHAQITRELLAAIEAKMLNEPVEVLKLNALFAAMYADAVTGHPSGAWQTTFSRFCPKGTPAVPVSAQQTLRCGAAMMQTHILHDLQTSLAWTRCAVDKEDYGNVLLLVKRGSEKANRMLYGERGAWVPDLYQFLYRAFMESAAKLVDPEYLRNETYKAQCGVDVPKPTDVFNNGLEDLKVE